MGLGTSPQSESVLCLLRHPQFGRPSPYKTYGGPWRTVTEISVTADHFPLAPSLRAAGSPHLVLSTQIRLGEVSASVGTPGRSNSRSPAAGASPLGQSTRAELRPHRPCLAMAYFVLTALQFALFVLVLAGRLDLTVASTLCTIDNVLVEGSVDTAGVSTTEVNVRALGHCRRWCYGCERC
jgi:hypothetical protein